MHVGGTLDVNNIHTPAMGNPHGWHTDSRVVELHDPVAVPDDLAELCPPVVQIHRICIYRMHHVGQDTNTQN